MCTSAPGGSRRSRLGRRGRGHKAFSFLPRLDGQADQLQSAIALAVQDLEHGPEHFPINFSAHQHAGFAVAALLTLGAAVGTSIWQQQNGGQEFAPDAAVAQG